MPYQKDLLNVRPTKLALASGRLLISVPFFNDSFFNRSVVLLTDYEEEHTAGLILNHPLPYKVDQLVDELHVDAKMFLGGPVMPSGLFLLHNFDSCHEASEIVPGVRVGYDKVLLALIEHNAIPAMKFRFLMGYAGWSPGQLEGELARRMWVVSKATSKLVFDTPPEEMWETAVMQLGPAYAHWLKVPKFVCLN